MKAAVRSLGILSVVISTASPLAAQSTSLMLADGSGLRGATGVLIDISTTASITVGSTDLVLVFDPAVLQATAVSSSTLGGFTFSIDNSLGRISTASATGSGNVLNAGQVLLTATFSIRPAAPYGPSALSLLDADGIPPDDLAGVPPPVPPPSIPYSTVPGTVTVLCGTAGGPLDVDGDCTVNVATDIVYIARHLLTLVPVPQSFRDLDPTIPPDAEIVTRIAALGSSLDVDANGTVDVATDIVYIARHLLSLVPVPPSFRVLDPTIPPNAEIVTRIESLLAE